jgi:origin recognition complex subunit 5
MRAGIVHAADAHALGVLAAPYFDHVRARLLDHDCEPAMASARAHALIAERYGPELAAHAALVASMDAAAASGATGAGAPQLVSRSGVGRSLETELPHMLKYLLVAAFCASHNPPETDVQFFSRRQSGRRRAQGGKSAARRTVRVAALEGPRPFALERLLAIFHSLVAANESLEESACVAHADLAAGIAQLQGLRLLTRVLPPSAAALARELAAQGGETYSCALLGPSAYAIAKNIKIDLGKYLYEDPGQ